MDIANEMGYSKPTISEQMKKFRENGYIETEADGHITLTEEGRRIAEQTLERHNVIAKIFMSLGVDEETAYQDACGVEHLNQPEDFYDLHEKHFEV